MDAPTFLKTATDPDQWLAKSAELRQAANRLWDSFFETTIRGGLHHRAHQPEAERSAWKEASAYLTSAKFFYGLSLETAFKAHILKSRPGEIEFKLSADGKGEIQEAEVKHFGVALGSGHNLEELAKRLGVLTVEGNPVFSVDSDIRALREILRHLTEVVYWSGRYPVPIRSGDRFQLSPDVPPIVLGHYIRDWIDPVLDYYQGDHAPPSDFEESVRRVQALVNAPSNSTSPDTPVVSSNSRD